MNKSQKLLEFIFLFFAEYRGLVPPNIIVSIIDENKNFQFILSRIKSFIVPI